MRSLACLVVMSVTSAICADETKETGPKLQPIFSDDFEKDTRKDFQINGDVAWKRGSLRIPNLASISGKLDAGSWVEADLDLQFPQKGAFQFAIQLDLEAAPGFGVVWTRKEVKGKAAYSISVLNTSAETDEDFVKNTWDPAEMPSGVWRVKYRYGAIVVSGPAEKRVFHSYEPAGFFAEEPKVQQWRISAAGAGVSLDSLRIVGSSKPGKLNDRQLREAAQAFLFVKQSVERYSQGKYGEALDLGEQALAIRKRVFGEQHLLCAESLNNLGNFHLAMGEYAKAEPLLLAARRIYKRVEGVEHPDHSLVLYNLSRLYKLMGEYAKAEPLSREAVKIDKRVLGTESPDYAISLQNLAILYRMKREYARAERLFVEANDIQERQLGKKHPRYAESLANLASLYSEMGEFSKSEQLFLEAREVRKHALGTKHPEYARTLNNLAALYKSMGEYAKAERLYLEAKDIDKQSLGTDHPSYAMSLQNLAVIYDAMEEYGQAEPLLVEAAEIFKKRLGPAHPSYTSCVQNLAGTYAAMGEYVKAEALYVKAMESSKRNMGTESLEYAHLLNNLAWNYVAAAEYDKAESLARQAFATMISLAKSIVPSLAEAQALEFQQVLPPTDFLLALLRRPGDHSDFETYRFVWESKALVTRMRANRQPQPGASKEALAVHAELRDLQNTLAQLVMARPDPKTAPIIRREMRTASERKEELEKRLATLLPATRRAIAIRDAKPEMLIDLLPEDTAVVDFVWHVDRRRVAKEIEYKSADGKMEKRRVWSMEPALVYDAFVLRHKGEESEVAWVELGESAPIEREIAAWRMQLTGNTRGVAGSNEPLPMTKQAIDPPQVLRSLVWRKLEAHLKGCKTVVMLPDGPLTGVPWAALPGREPGTFLIEDYAIATAAYGQQLYGLLSDEPVQSNGVLVVGGINYDEESSAPEDKALLLANQRRSPAGGGARSQWKFLPGTLTEAEKIAKLSKERTPALTGTKASESAFASEVPGSRYVHLATHGFFASPEVKSIFAVDPRDESLFGGELGSQRKRAAIAGRNPLLLSGVVLAGANLEPKTDDLGLPIGEDGILTAEEVTGLDLHDTELVTLSACETGLGDVAAGEGVFGLQRAFHQAGARAVVASLWKVDDNATQALMVEFYKNLWQNKMGKLEALRAAQLKMIRGYDPKSGEVRGLGTKSVPIETKGEKPKRLPPIYWAAFQLSGDWR